MRRIIMIICLALLILGCAAPERPAENISQNITPAAPIVSCAETDTDDESSAGSTMKYVDGTIEEEWKDLCLDSGHIMEFYCSGDSVMNKTVECAEGTECKDATCVQKPPEPPVPDCQETDSGKDYYKAGKVTYKSTISEDVCQGNYDLLEYYCEDDARKEETHHCLSGENCKGGACIPLDRSCTDTDSQDQSAAGTASQYGGGMVIATYNDACIDQGRRREYYCENGIVMNRTEGCASDEYCSNGACIPKCFDKDGGRNYKEASYVTVSSGKFIDYCSDTDTLVEYYCEGDDVYSKSTVCPNYCYEGSCLSGSDIECEEYLGGSIVKLKYEKETLAQYNDTCLDHRVLRDYLCISDEVDYFNEKCDDGELCYMGECVMITQKACFDLDAGKLENGIYESSMVILTDNDSIDEVKEDYCMDSTTVFEYSCDGTKSDLTTYKCPKDYECEDGACVYPYTCTETDSGISLEAGEASLWDGNELIRTEKDACTGSGDVWETYCEDGLIKYTTIRCPSGMACDSKVGECV